METRTLPYCRIVHERHPEISGRPVDRLLIIILQICTGAFDNSGGFLDFAQEQYVNELAVSCCMTRCLREQPITTSTTNIAFYAMGHATSCAYQKIGCHSPRILIVNKRSGRKTYQTIRVIQSDPLFPSSFQVTYVPVNFWKGPRNHPPKNTQQNDKQIISKTNT